MNKRICSAVVVAFALCSFPTWAQNTAPSKPGTAIYIPDAATKAKLKDMIANKVQDDAVRIVNTGDGNLGVFLIHLNPGQTPQEPIALMSHNDVSEVYY